jgi:hypothetical protein
MALLTKKKKNLTKHVPHLKNRWGILLFSPKKMMDNFTFLRKKQLGNLRFVPWKKMEDFTVFP